MQRLPKLQPDILNPRLAADDYRVWYESVFQDKRRNITTVEEVAHDIAARSKYQSKLRELPYFRNFIDAGSSCLEIGGGWGTLARAIKDSIGSDIDVIEPSKLAARVGREHFGLNVYRETFEQFATREKGKKKYDLIYAYHVFEHIADPNGFLEKIKDFLKPSGILLLALPDTSHPEVPAEKLFHIEHCFYYTPRTVTMMLGKHGLGARKIWCRRKDMVVAASREAAANRVSFANADECAMVKRAIARRGRLTAFLRGLKKVAYSPLSEEQKTRANRFLSKILQKL